MFRKTLILSFTIRTMSILAFGEILLRIQGQNETFWDDTNADARLYPGGSEANVAATLAKLGHQVDYLTAFPDNVLAHQIRELLERLGVNCAKSITTGSRIGTYYLLTANGLSSGEVVYDRKYSSFTDLHIGKLDIEELFAGVSWFHWTAITPALSLEHADLLAILLQEAQNRGIFISVDLNYRSKLWQYGKAPSEIMPRLVAFCDVVMGNVWAAEKMLGYSLQQKLERHSTKKMLSEEANRCASMIFSDFTQTKHIAMTYRFMDNPNHNLFFGTYHTADCNYVSETRESHHIVDRIGSGDAFMAGLIHAIYSGMTGKEIIETATEEGFKKLFIEGDFDLQK